MGTLIEAYRDWEIFKDGRRVYATLSEDKRHTIMGERCPSIKGRSVKHIKDKIDLMTPTYRAFYAGNNKERPYTVYECYKEGGAAYGLKGDYTKGEAEKMAEELNRQLPQGQKSGENLPLPFEEGDNNREKNANGN